MQANIKFGFLNRNVLKIIAAICMFIDHLGLILFPNLIVLRVIGRLSFPIFAFFIAEGCRYTRNKLRYLGILFALSVVFQVVYLIFEGDWFFSVFVTFTLAVLAIYAWQFVVKSFRLKKSWGFKFLSIFVFVCAIFVIYILNKFLTIDYGFWGCMLPLFASIFCYSGESVAKYIIFNKFGNLILFAGCLVLLGFAINFPIQMYALYSVILLAFYSGKCGKLQMKYFFYIFYPAHLVILYLIDFVL